MCYLGNNILHGWEAIFQGRTDNGSSLDGRVFQANGQQMKRRCFVATVMHHERKPAHTQHGEHHQHDKEQPQQSQCSNDIHASIKRVEARLDATHEQVILYDTNQREHMVDSIKRHERSDPGLGS